MSWASTSALASAPACLARSRIARHGFSADRAVDRRAGELLRGLAELGPVTQREPERLLPVPEAQPRRRVGGVRRDALHLQRVRELLRGRRIEAHGLAAAGDRRKDLRRPVREQQQDDVRRRLLERLEQRVRGLVVHHVHALEHEDPVRRLERRVRGGRDNRLVDVLAQHLVRAARLDPGEVGMAAVVGADLDVVRVLRAAREQLAGERAGDVALARARGAVEQVRVGGRILERGAEDGLGVGVVSEVQHVALDPRRRPGTPGS